MKPKMRTLCRCLRNAGLAAGTAALSLPFALAAPTELADSPINAALPSPVNVLLTPSVEYPTATVLAYKDSQGGYSSGKTYVGYFDPDKCYTYNQGQQYFEPTAIAGSYHSCSGSWSGNALNFGMATGIDTFRWGLTGGYRAIDTASTSNSNRGVTVLQFSYQGQYSEQYTERSIPGPSGQTSITRIKRGLNVSIGGNTYVARVRVCDDRKGPAYLEDNCLPYIDDRGVITYKPVGLIQRYEDKMRFGVFSYLYNEYNYDDKPRLDGAVLRARLKSVGSTDWKDEANPAYEWSPTTGVFVDNPDRADASASGVPNSGVINYINKFGFTSQGYEVFDQPSEMYAEALRYLMKKPPTSSYYSRANDSPRRKDGFPVITNWEDPILNHCQTNAILGIGDIYTHFEDNFGVLPFDPFSWTNKLGRIEGTSNLDLKTFGWSEPKTTSALREVPHNGSRGGSYMIAGMAYYAHTNDIRPDISEGEKMTVETFWVDVVEQGVLVNPGFPGNQYMLAAKYGGFKDVNGNGVFDPGVDIWNEDKRTYSDGTRLPDNFFAGDDPQAMVAGLEQAFTKIAALQIEGKGTGAGWIRDEDTDSVFDPGYKSGTWSGTLSAGLFEGFNKDGTVKQTQIWDATEKIDAQNWDNGRKIIAGKITGGNYSAVPFRKENLSAEQLSALNLNPDLQEKTVAYLRGSREFEGTDFRKRPHVLGDIVHSKPVIVRAPKGKYMEAYNPGYADFKDTYEKRAAMLYVGANDGMLHAIDAATTGPEVSRGGEERWAYIPSLLFNGPSDPATPQVDGLAALTKASYSHRFYVDATPAVVDVDFNRTGGIVDNNVASDWRSLLVGGLGKGGKGFFALDVTDPDKFTTEADAKNQALWEFAPDDMGYSFGYPGIVKTSAWGWVVLLTSGYNNPSGKGILYIVNAKTGELLKTVDTEVGTPENPAGLTQIESYSQLLGGYVADQVYGGDLLGNVWRFDLTDPKGEVAVHKLAQLTDKDGNPQPVTVAPRIHRPNQTIDHRWIFVATGQLLSKNDVKEGPGAQTQTVYAIRDGGRYETEPAGSPTLKRADFDKVTDLVLGLDDTPEHGWYYDMTGNIDGATERVTFDMTSIGDVISWTGVIPSGIGAVCEETSMSGTSRIYAVGFENAQSAIRVDNAPAPFLTVDILAVDTQIYINKEDGSLSFVVSGTTGSDFKPNGEIDLSSMLNPHVVNWRQAN